MRATSKRLCFMASMALSKRTLSGCLEPTLARGLTDFLLEQAAVSSSNAARNAMKEFLRNILRNIILRNIKTSNQHWCRPLAGLVSNFLRQAFYVKPALWCPAFTRRGERVRRH